MPTACPCFPATVLSMRHIPGLFCLLVLSLWSLGSVAYAQTVGNGYYYHVQPEDTWFFIARITGHTVDTLQGTNPQLIRDYDILYQNDRVLIPADFSREAPRYHQVVSGESWSAVSGIYDVPIKLLKAANPEATTGTGALVTGISLFIPPVGNPELPVPATPTPFPDSVIVPPAYRTGETDPAAIFPLEPYLPATSELVPHPELPEPACPTHHGENIGFLEDVLAYWTYLPQGMVQSAQACGLAIDTLITDRDINGDGFIDLLVTYGQADDRDSRERMDLALFHWQGDGLVLELRARAAGQLALLAVGDVNEDQRKDLVWTDKSCGRDICYTAVYVQSWDDEAETWRTGLAEPLAMVNAQVRLRGAEGLGDGLALYIQGGTYSRTEAGPQRARTEIWASRQGGLFTRVAREYAPTSYLYHVVMEAHHKTVQSSLQNLHDAQTLYRQALADNTLEVWHNMAERDYLRAFSLLRLAIIASYQQQPDIAAEIINVLNQAYPASDFAALGQIWHKAYAGSLDSVVACTAALAYVQANPATWQPFAAFGYANAPLYPSEICPILDMYTEAGTDTPAGTGQARDGNPALPSPFAALANLRDLDPVAFADSDDLPACPGTLDGYPRAIENLLNGLEGDLLLVETWLRLCEAVTDRGGTVQVGDLNGDGQEDLVVIVVQPDAQGLGPGKVSSHMMVYYRSFANLFNLIFQPPVLGLPALLALEDINEDGQQDLIWVDEVCNFLCLSTVEILSWDGDYVNNFIRKGATIANGDVRLAPVPDTNPGQGQQIILSGGISGLIEEEKQVSHVELWESIDGQPYQRVWFEYDPTNPASRCLGLTLVEADVVLGNAVSYGYGPALQMYRDILDNPTLTACGVTDIPGEVEMALLRGLAFFRLVQTHALAGDMRAAMLAVQEMNRALVDDNPFLAIARDWRQAYAAAANPVYACQAILPLIQAEPSTWQVTDIFGMDHPAESETTLCFVPETTP